MSREAKKQGTAILQVAVRIRCHSCGMVRVRRYRYVTQAKLDSFEEVFLRLHDKLHPSCVGHRIIEMGYGHSKIFPEGAAVAVCFHSACRYIEHIELVNLDSSSYIDAEKRLKRAHQVLFPNCSGDLYVVVNGTKE